MNIWEARHKLLLCMVYMDSLFPSVANHSTGEACLVLRVQSFERELVTWLCVDAKSGTSCLLWIFMHTFNNAESLVHPGSLLQIYRKTPSSVTIWTFQKFHSQCLAKVTSTALDIPIDKQELKKERPALINVHGLQL